jgi:DNA invertase Pin-like site-specific DNA recombinase
MQHRNATRAIGLIRVSQRDKDALSPEVQRRAIIALAQEHGWSLREQDILDENVDDNGKLRNVSGSWELEDRPKLRYALGEVEAGRAKVILGERFDRMFRNELLRRMVVKRVQDSGAELWSDKSGQMTNQTAEGRLAHNVNGDVSEYTLETAMERSWDAVELAIEQGKFAGPVVPPGYEKGADGVLVKGSPKAVQTVQRAFELRDGGATFGEVRAFLAKRGIKRSESGVRKMLASKVYVGEVHFGKHTPNLEAHDPIIARDLFDRVQGMVVPAGRKGKSKRLLARLGVVHCGTCGGRMSATVTQTDYPFYRCANEDCERRMSAGAQLVEEWVVAELQEEAKEIEGRASEEGKVAELAAKAERSKAAYAKAQRILSDAEDEDEARAILAAKRLERDADREAHGAARDHEEGSWWVARVKDWDKLSWEGRRKLIQAAIKSVPVNPGRGVERLGPIEWR